MYDKIDDKPATAYSKRQNDLSESKEKKKGAIPYKNPKKRKRSIDEGASITPLTPTFRREDLERLEQEHKMVMKESEEDGEEPPEIEIDTQGVEVAAQASSDVVPETDVTNTDSQDGRGDAAVKDEQKV